MNYKAVHGTAPATPSLLIIYMNTYSDKEGKRGSSCPSWLITQGLRTLGNSVIKWWFVKISLWPCHAITVADGAFSHKIDYITILKEILNYKGHQNRNNDSKVTEILLNGWILLIGEASSGRVCACSLRSRLIFNTSWIIRILSSLM